MNSASSWFLRGLLASLPLLPLQLSSAAEETFEAWKKGLALPAARVPEVSAAPRIDGKIDSLYQASEVFTLSYLDGFAGTPEEPALGLVVSHQGRLYVAVRCAKKEPKRIVNKTEKHDGQIWDDESVELFLDPEKTRDFNYYHLIVNSAGVTYDARTHDYKTRGDLSWNPELAVKCLTDEKGWTMELSIPFSAFGAEEGKLNRIWSFNLNRSSRDPDDPDCAEDTAWSPTRTRTNHLPARFGYLWLDAGNRDNR